MKPCLSAANHLPRTEDSARCTDEMMPTPHTFVVVITVCSWCPSQGVEVVEAEVDCDKDQVPFECTGASAAAKDAGNADGCCGCGDDFASALCPKECQLVAHCAKCVEIATLGTE